jgi:hypothetical protein
MWHELLAHLGTEEFCAALAVKIPGLGHFDALLHSQLEQFLGEFVVPSLNGWAVYLVDAIDHELGVTA